MATGLAGGGSETTFCRGMAPALAPSVVSQSMRRATLRVEVEPFNHARRVSRHMPNRPQVQRRNNLAFGLERSGGCGVGVRHNGTGPRGLAGALPCTVQGAESKSEPEPERQHSSAHSNSHGSRHGSRCRAPDYCGSTVWHAVVS